MSGATTEVQRGSAIGLMSIDAVAPSDTLTRVADGESSVISATGSEQ